jgi:acyl transferase domain-containing protein
LEWKYDAGHGYRQLPAHDVTYYRDLAAVAVISFSFRLHGRSLWQALLACHDLVTSVEPNRWAPGMLLHPNKSESGLRSPRFDAAFFGISPREAEQGPAT